MLATLSRLAQRERLLVVLDEYQYVAEADPTLASQLRLVWAVVELLALSAF